MKVAGFRLGILAFVVTAIVSLIPYLGWFLIAPLVALTMAAAAGRSVATVNPTRPAYEAAKAGAWVGAGALVGSVAALGILALVVVSIPGVPDFIRASEPHLEARIPYEWIAPLGTLAGVMVGFLIGLFDLMLSVVGGFFAGWIYDHNRRATV